MTQKSVNRSLVKMFASKNPMESDSNPEEPEKKKLSAKEQIK